MENHNKGITAAQIKELVGNSPLMLEIGSHDGEDTLRFLREMTEINLHCFEPEVRAIERFRRKITCASRAVLYEVAVADIDGFRQFYASTGNVGRYGDWDYSGSLCEPTGHYTRSPRINFKAPVSVPCIRLDSWYALFRHTSANHNRVIDFIWADIQGSQRLVVAGGTEALAHTRYLYIEAHNPVAYAGEPTQEELIELLSEWFEPLEIYMKENLLFKNRGVSYENC